MSGNLIKQESVANIFQEIFQINNYLGYNEIDAFKTIVTFRKITTFSLQVSQIFNFHEDVVVEENQYSSQKTKQKIKQISQYKLWKMIEKIEIIRSRELYGQV